MGGDVLERLVDSGRTVDGILAVIATPVEGLPLSVWLCAAPWDAMDEGLRGALERAWPSGAQRSRRQPWRPLPVRPHAATHPDDLLEPIRVPADPREVADSVADATVRLCRALRLLPFRTAVVGELNEPSDIDPVGWDFDDPELPPWASEDDARFDAAEFAGSTRWLLDELAGGTLVHRYATVATGIIQALARDVLPEFVTDRYELQVRPRGVTDIARGDAVEIVFKDTVTDAEFPITRVASGHALCVQLALRELVARVRWYATVLDEGALRLRDVARADDGESDAVQIVALHLALRQMLLMLQSPDLLTRGHAEELIDAHH
jgi:hypothetical protein